MTWAQQEMNPEDRAEGKSPRFVARLHSETIRRVTLVGGLCMLSLERKLVRLELLSVIAHVVVIQN